MADDLLLALRRLRQAPAFTILAVLTLALGLGLGAGLGSLLNAVVLRTLPVREPGRLVAISRVNRHGQVRWMPLSTMIALARDSRTFEGVCGYAEGGLFTVNPGGLPMQSPFEFVSGGCYELAGAKAHVGRLISEQDAPSTGEPARVAVLGYGFWQRHYGGDPAVIGRVLRVEGLPLVIIGVTPPGFSGLQVDVAPDVTVPATLLPALGVGRPGATQVNYLVARLRPGLDLGQARARVSAAWPAVQAETMPSGLGPEQQSEFRSFEARLESLARGFSHLRTDYARPLVLLTALAGLLLVLAVTNLSGFVLARTMAREHELAVRAALGASRLQIVRMLVVEILVLAAAGFVLAAAFAWWTARWLGWMLWTGQVPLTVLLAPDWRVLSASGAVALLVAVAMTVAAAWPTVRGEPTRALRPGLGAGGRVRRWGGPLLIVQLAASLVLVFSASLFVRSLARLNANPTGASIDTLVLARLADQPSKDAATRSSLYYQELLRRVGALPGVRAASLSRLFPAIGDEASLLKPVASDGLPAASSCRAVVDVVAPGFFDTARIALLRGRDFTWHDDATRPSVAVVNASAARLLFGREDPIGRHIRVGTEPGLQAVEVVGLVDDATMGNARSPHVPIVVRPALQDLRFAQYSAIVIRTEAPGAALNEAVRRTVASLGVDYVTNIRSGREQLRASVAQDQVLTVLSLLFGGVAAVIAYIGVFAILALDVSRRQREIGVRVSLGATRTQVIHTVVGRALAAAAGGIVIGVPGALAASRLTSSLLYGVTPADPVSLCLAVALLGALALAGSAVPAARAARVDPIVTLKAE